MKEFLLTINFPTFRISTNVLFLSIFLNINISYSQIIRTIAGNGIIGNSGNGGPAIDASFYGPSSLRFNGDGDLFVADFYNHVIRKIDQRNNNITVYAGNGIAGYSGDGDFAINASLNGPVDLDFDREGNLYIADQENNCIRKVDATTGRISTVAGNGSSFFLDNVPALIGGINNPNAIAVDEFGNIYISEPRNHRIRKVDKLSGIISTVVGIGSYGSDGDGGLAIHARISSPLGLRVNTKGDILFVDAESHTLRRVDGATRIITTLAGRNTAGFSGDGGPAINAYLNSPTDVQPDKNGDLYITDGYNSVIRRISASDQTISTIAGTGIAGFLGDEGHPLCARLNVPTEIVIDRNGDLYFTDFENQRIRKIFGIANSAAGPSILIKASINDVCLNTAITFTAKTYNSPPTAKYRWYVNGINVGPIAGSFTSSNLLDGDIIQAKLESINICGLSKIYDSDTIIVRIKAVPLVELFPKDTAIYKGQNVQLRATIAGSFDSFRWTPPNTLSNLQSLTPLASPATSTTYQISVLTANGCNTI